MHARHPTQVRGYHLDARDKTGSSDPYLRMCHISPGIALESGGHRIIWESEVIKRNLNPCWAPVKLKLSTVCPGGDLAKPLVMQCFDKVSLLVFLRVERARESTHSRWD